MELRVWTGLGIAAGIALAAIWVTPANASGLRSDFSKRPTQAERAATILRDLKDKNSVGTASALCEVVGGHLEACRVISEHPQDSGLGKAALDLAPLYELPKQKEAVCDKAFHQAIFSVDWPIVDKPADWTLEPSGSDVYRNYPREAQIEGLSGAGAVRCQAPAGSSAFTGCEIIFEDPAGHGFGAAILSLTPLFRVSSAVKDGKPVDSEVVIPFNFPVGKC